MMRMKRFTYKGIWITTVLLSAALTVSCGKEPAQEESQTEQSAATEAPFESSGTIEESPTKQSALETAEIPALSPEEKAAAFTAEMAQSIQKDGEHLYFIYQDKDLNYRICRQAEAGGSRTDMIEESFIRLFSADQGNLYVECEGAVWFVDGETLEKEKLFDIDRPLQNLCVKDGLLYCESRTEDATAYEQVFYALNADGRIGEKPVLQESSPALSVASEGGTWWMEAEDFALSLRDGEVFYVERGADGQAEAEGYPICKGYPTVLYYDEDFLYLRLDSDPVQEESFFDVTEILRFDRKRMETETIADIPGEAGNNGIYLKGPTSIGILDGRIYYVYLDQEEGKDYLMRCEPGAPEGAVKVGDAISTDLLFQLGTVSIEGENLFCPVCGARDWYWQQKLFLDEKYPGDEAVNAYLDQFYREKAAYAKEFVEQNSVQEDSCIHQYISSPISSEQMLEVMYDGERYLNLINQSYEYGGGAHGMPYREPLLFDRETGEKLALGDVIGNTEEELKTLVADAFCNPPYHEGLEDWANRRESVYQAAGMNMLFYLSEDGITFYFTPYEVGSYAEGFPAMTVPYSALKMKISP